MNIVLITGASSGLGAEFARQLDKLSETSSLKTNPKTEQGRLILEDTCFWLVARRKERLEALNRELTHKTKIFPLDLRDRESISVLENALKEDQAKISVFVNGAGLGYYGTVDQLLPKQISTMLDVNVKALTLLTNRISPYLIRQAWLIQIASSAAFLPQPGFSVYAASKAYVYSITRALRRELKDRKIHVTALCPGPVSTEFFQIAETSHYTMPAYKKLFFAKPIPVVKKCLKDVSRNKSRSIYGLSMKLAHIFSKLLPSELFLKFF